MSKNESGQARTRGVARAESTADSVPDVVVLGNSWLEAPTPVMRSDSAHRIINWRLSDRVRRWSASGCAAIATLIMHSLLLAPFMIGTGHRKQSSPHVEGSIVSAHIGEESGSTLVFLNDYSINTLGLSESQAGSAMERVERIIEKAILSASIDDAVLPPTVEFEQQDSVEASYKEQGGDGVGLAELFGRYMGQIQSRIARAWIYPPRSSQPNFRCNVQIKQSRRGDVQEVMLQRCDHDIDWQLSLVKAIESASPLSAPPIEKVFSELVALDFSASLSKSDIRGVPTLRATTED